MAVWGDGSVRIFYQRRNAQKARVMMWREIQAWSLLTVNDSIEWLQLDKWQVT